MNLPLDFSCMTIGTQWDESRAHVEFVEIAPDRYQIKASMPGYAVDGLVAFLDYTSRGNWIVSPAGKVAPTPVEFVSFTAASIYAVAIAAEWRTATLALLSRMKAGANV